MSTGSNIPSKVGIVKLSVTSTVVCAAHPEVSLVTTMVYVPDGSPLTSESLLEKVRSAASEPGKRFSGKVFSPAYH